MIMFMAVSNQNILLLGFAYVNNVDLVSGAKNVHIRYNYDYKVQGS